jgi:hypothetical protein
VIRDEDDKTLVPLTPSGLRLFLILTIVFIVVSSPIIIFNPALAVTASPTPLPTVSTIPSAPSTIGQDGKEGDFTTQAALQIPRTLQSTDLVNSLAFYEVTFITSTAGAIDKIRMDFPAGTNVAAAGVIERIGIGGGTLLKSGSSITYDVTTPVNIPAGTFIRLEMSGIKNPANSLNEVNSFTATITTRNSGGNLIDGPSQTNVYTIRQIGTNDVADLSITNPKLAPNSVSTTKYADNSITFTKPALNFMKRVSLTDTTGGNDLGWNPDSVTTLFTISDTEVVGFDDSFISVEVWDDFNTNYLCDTTDQDEGSFSIRCSSPPVGGSELHYMLVNLPGHLNE